MTTTHNHIFVGERPSAVDLLDYAVRQAQAGLTGLAWRTRLTVARTDSHVGINAQWYGKPNALEIARRVERTNIAGNARFCARCGDDALTAARAGDWLTAREELEFAVRVEAQCHESAVEPDELDKPWHLALVLAHHLAPLHTVGASVPRYAVTPVGEAEVDIDAQGTVAGSLCGCHVTIDWEDGGGMTHMHYLELVPRMPALRFLQGLDAERRLARVAR